MELTLRANRCVAVMLVVLAALQGSMRAAAHASDSPETVMITFHARPGAESKLAAAIANHWTVTRRLNLVRPDPHVTLRASDGAETVQFVEIFTWRDAAIPDHAPAAVLTIWEQMNQLVETRNGHQGMEITPVTVVAAR